jgi:hypothetical protein
VELKDAGWIKARVWATDAISRPTNDSFDGWKVFTDLEGNRFGVGAEVEWNWERVYFDFLKFWRAQVGGQISVGIQILRGPNAFDYAVNHQYVLYGDLIPNLKIVFCALDANDLRTIDYEKKTRQFAPYPMP